jgi:hypothetical protein
MRTLIRHLLIAATAAFVTPVHADFYLVVQTGNPQRALTQKEAVDMFMGRSRSFGNGDFALVFDLPRDNPRRAAFYLALTGMSPAQVNSYWARLMFSGQSMPPQPLPDETAMIDIVKRNPSALGWLSKEPTDKQLRTLLVLKESP